MAKKLTPMKQAYQKELARIRRFMNRATKRGYSFDSVSLPKTPKRVTAKALERLKKQYSAEQLYLKATYTSPKGVKLLGAEGRKLERKAAAQKAAATRRLNRQPVPAAPPAPPAPGADYVGGDAVPVTKSDDEILKNVPIRRGPYLIDPETGEVIADESNNILDSFLEQINKFDSIDSAALPYRDVMLDWFYNAMATYGDKFTMALKQLHEMGIGITYQTLRYEEQMTGFMISFYKQMARLGYMTQAQADNMIEQMQDIMEWDDQSLYE